LREEEENMIVVQILGTSYMPEEQLKEITKKIISLSNNQLGEDAWVGFPPDQMKWELGTEIVALVSGPKHGDKVFFDVLHDILENQFPAGTKIGIQSLEGKTIYELSS
jgi:hypothetical protein